MPSEDKLTPARSSEKQRATQHPAWKLAQHAVDAVLDKKARDVVLLDMRKVSGIADYFLVCTGGSELQVRAITEAIRERLREQCGEKPWHAEGTDHNQWVVVDYVDLVVHVFLPSKREYYDLERLWGDAPMEEIEEEGSSEQVEMLQQAEREAADE